MALNRSEGRRTSDVERRSNQLARLLVSYGVRPGTSVVVALERSAHSVFGQREFLLARWAVRKAGGSAIVIDPTLPPREIHALVVESGADLGLTVNAYSKPLPGQVHWIELDNPDVTSDWARQRPAPLTGYWLTEGA